VHSCTRGCNYANSKLYKDGRGELLFLIDPDGKADAFKAFQGYYKNPEATNKKVARDVLKKGDYFFRTGDVLKLHYDGSRRYTAFEDRIGDTFRWKGENVSTMVISAVLNAANW
jgi:acyl-coenzyme A synthetase/AMP-(fatty) acid ligase